MGQEALEVVRREEKDRKKEERERKAEIQRVMESTTTTKKGRIAMATFPIHNNSSVLSFN